jgi:hypothetical protein
VIKQPHQVPRSSFFIFYIKNQIKNIFQKNGGLGPFAQLFVRRLLVLFAKHFLLKNRDEEEGLVDGQVRLRQDFDAIHHLR